MSKITNVEVELKHVRGVGSTDNCAWSILHLKSLWQIFLKKTKGLIETNVLDLLAISNV